MKGNLTLYILLVLEVGCFVDPVYYRVIIKQPQVSVVTNVVLGHELGYILPQILPLIPNFELSI